MSEFITTIVFFAFCIIVISVKRVPKDTVYIIDKHTHYHKTVKNGYFFLNPMSHTITTKISIHPITTNYMEVFESDDGRNYIVAFTVTYSAKNMEDVLYNLEKVRRSIDDILKSCMYGAMLTLSSKAMSKSLLMETFMSNLESEAMTIGLNINNFNIYQLAPTAQTTRPPFRPHKNYSDAEDPIKFY